MGHGMPTSELDLSALRLAEPGAEYTSESSQRRWIEVLVDCPGTQGLFTYRLPPGLKAQPGDILSVPFGVQQVGAIAIRAVTNLPPDLDPAQLRDVAEIVCAGFFPAYYWQLLQQVAQYYYTPLIQVIRVALPPRLLGRSQRRIQLKSEAIPPGAIAFLSPPAQQILQRLQDQKAGNYTWQYLQRQIKGASRGLRELTQRGWVESYLEPPASVKPKHQQAVTLIASAAVDDLDLTARQQEILDVLKRRGGDLWLTELLQICHTSSSTLKTLQTKGCIVIQSREVLRTEVGPKLQADSAKVLTADQAQALASIKALSGFAQILLHGVTGSGKTEVYLQAIAPVLQQGQSALVLVPEIGLTPQLTDRFRARFGQRVCVYHSALSDGERYDTWRQMLSGDPQVVIGTRSAVFAPLPHLGLIVLDEEHDSSFKQDQPTPCYHARTVAQWRAELENCPLILGSATPSLETWVQIKLKREQANPSSPIPANPTLTTANSSRLNQSSTPSPLTPHPSLTYLSLPERVQSRPMPPIQVVDMRQELQQGNGSIFSRPLHSALEQLQERGQRGILFIHRRGHSTFVSCRSCGYVTECPNCDVSLSYHHSHEGAQRLLRCHYCNYTRSHPPNCPACGSPYFKHFGSGTQRVAQELAWEFPQLRCIRFDSDTTRTKGAHRTLLTQFAQGEADLLVGTQMLTKGIDLPQVTLVGVVAADGLLHLADYRAGERAFQTLTQVAGRAGRGEDPGQVIIQTYSPEHPVIQAVQRHESESFLEAELQQRAALNYPPEGRMILLRLSSPDPVAVQTTAEQLAAILDQAQDYELLGPAPAQIMRVARRYRWQILLKFSADSAAVLPLMELRSQCPASVSLTIDVDPLNLL